MAGDFYPSFFLSLLNPIFPEFVLSVLPVDLTRIDLTTIVSKIKPL